MAIFASKAGSIDLNGLLNRVRLDNEPNDGDYIIWDDKSQSFVVKKPVKGPGISKIVSHGGSNVNTVANKIVEDTIYFKEIIAGSGVSISQTDTSITLNNTLSANTLSSDSSYSITIDNGSTNPRSKFEIRTALTPTNGLEIDFVPSTGVYNIPNVYSGVELGKSYFQTRHGTSFNDIGFKKGQFTKVEFAGRQSGEFTVENVETNFVPGIGNVSTLWLVEQFTGDQLYDLGGPKTNVRFSQSEIRVSPPRTLSNLHDPSLSYELVSSNADFGPNGLNLRSGMTIHLENTLNEMFDGSYVIDNVVSRGPNFLDYSKIHVGYQTPFNNYGIIESKNNSEHPKLKVNHYVGSTGFSVEKTGMVNATNVKLSEPPMSDNEATRKDYVDNAVNQVIKKDVEMYFFSFF